MCKEPRKMYVTELAWKAAVCYLVKYYICRSYGLWLAWCAWCCAWLVRSKRKISRVCMVNADSVPASWCIIVKMILFMRLIEITVKTRTANLTLGSNLHGTVLWRKGIFGTAWILNIQKYYRENTHFWCRWEQYTYRDLELCAWYLRLMRIYFVVKQEFFERGDSWFITELFTNNSIFPMFQSYNF